MTICINQCTSRAPDGEIPVTVPDGSTLCHRCQARLKYNLGTVADLHARLKIAVNTRLETRDNLGISSGGSKARPPMDIAAIDSCLAVTNNLAELWWLLSGKDLAHMIPKVRPPASKSGSWFMSGLDDDTIQQIIADIALNLTHPLWWEQLVTVDECAPVATEFNRACERANALYPEYPREVEQRPRPCPGCMGRERTVWADISGDTPIVRCNSCGWEFAAEWERILCSL